MATLGVRGSARVSARAGLMTGADAAANPADVHAKTSTQKTLGLDTSTWVLIITGAAVAYIALMYFGHGGSRGAVL